MSKDLKLSKHYPFFLILIFLILIISAILRFYNLPETFVFAGDEEHQSILAQSIAKDFHIIWIGVNAAHLGFYLGPYWVYFTSFWLWLSKGDPLITGYVSSTIGILTTLLIILVGSTVFRRSTGLIAGLLYATLPLMVFFDQRYWNPTPIPLLSVLMFLALCKLKQNPKLAILFSLSFGMVFHIHLSLIPLIFVAIFWVIREEIKLSKRIIFLSLISFILMISPLIAYDYFHKGTNITTPLRFKEISAESVNKVNPTHHFRSLFQTLGRVWYIKPYSVNGDEVIAPCASSSRTDTKAELDIFSKRFNPPLFLSITGSAILLLFMINRSTWQKRNNLLLALIIFSIVISFLFFPGAAFEYYLLGIFPLLLFIPGIFISYFKGFKDLIILVIFLISALGIFTVFTNKPEFGLKVKKTLIQQIASFIDDQPFELKQKGLCHDYEGFRYLFVLQGKKPERSDSDHGLGWLYQTEITSKPVKYKVLLQESRIPIQFEAKDAKVLEAGGFRAYIFKNY